MISVSDAWKEKHTQRLLPESFVEIECAITESGLQETAVASGTDESVVSNVERITGLTDSVMPKYATLEHNLWSLDGTRSLLKGEQPYVNTGYVSNGDGGSVTLALPEIHTVAIPGVTITWSEEFGEYATDFTVTAKNGDTVVAETTVTGNDSVRTVVDLGIENYDSVTITVNEWCVPNHRSRVEKFVLGQTIVFTKSDIFNYEHEQTGCINSGELPKNHIRFSINNIGGVWNPTNPTGFGKYLSERQKITVRYGMDVDGSTEWIKAGTFYLSEWSAPSNGIEASFVARDVFEYMMNEKYSGITSGTLLKIAQAAITQAALPSDVVVELDSALSSYSATIPDSMKESTLAEILQYCANAAMCVMYQDRYGKIIVTKPTYEDSGYVIRSEFSYSYPEIEYTKPLKNVVVKYGDNSYTLNVSESGESQTVTNDLVKSSTQATKIAEWVRDALQSRKNTSGEFRGDPRLDVFDFVTVESKFGDVAVIITDVRYMFSGAFRATYKGRVIEGAV